MCCLGAMTVRIGIKEAKVKLSELMARAHAGEEVIITRRGKAVVVMRPFAAQSVQPRA